jgi:CubicO group peptidase (beta-lactamase class C family)
MRTILILCVVALLLISCDKLLLGEDDAIIGLEENLQAPPALQDGWEVSSLASENIKPDAIAQLVTNLQSNPRNIHSLIIVRNNKLVSESYFDGWHRDRPHAIRSDAKSFMSTLVGIAIDQGHISSVEQPVFDFFPEYNDLNMAPKNTMKIKHILTMTAGLQWDEATYFAMDDMRNDEYAIEQQSDRLRYLLGKEQKHLPGAYFLYNSGLPILESALVKKATGENVDVFADKYLFKPLNITNYYLRMNQDGYVAAVPLLLRPRDMAKLGQVFLDGGKWKGEQIVSENWVAAASSSIVTNTSSFAGAGPGTGYGYHWWTEQFTIDNKTIQTFAAEGNGGQYIFVVPSLNAVVVFTGGNYNKSPGALFILMRNTILPAMNK